MRLLRKNWIDIQDPIHCCSMFYTSGWFKIILQQLQFDLYLSIYLQWKTVRETYRCERDIGIVIRFDEHICQREARAQRDYRDENPALSTYCRQRHRDSARVTESRKLCSSAFYMYHDSTMHEETRDNATSARSVCASSCIPDPWEPVTITWRMESDGSWSYVANKMHFFF